MRSLVVAALLLLVPSIASAQPGLAQPSPPTIEPGDKDPAVATLLAVGGTLAGFVVFKVSLDKESLGGAAAGGALLVVGPSAGHIYAGRADRAVGMSLVRAAGLGLQIAGTIQWVESGFFCGDECDSQRANSGLVLMLAGAAIFTVAAAVDIADARHAARRYNANRRSMSFSPGLARTATGEGVPMLALGGSF